MDIVGLIINLVSGLIGGNAAGLALKDKSLGAIGNSIAGLIGGAAGGYILQAVGLLTTMGMADMTVGSVLGHLGTGVISGGVLTAIVGFIKNAIVKK